MIQGEVRCTCGQVFGFATIMPTVACPKCGMGYSAAEFGTAVVEEPVEELPGYEIPVEE